MAGKAKVKQLSPFEKAKARIIAEAIDNYEREHKLGLYQPQGISTIAGPAPYPTTEELDTLSSNLEQRLHVGRLATKKEGVRQDFELAIHHIRIANRYIGKALAI